jgi:hypothetical protein
MSTTLAERQAKAAAVARRGEDLAIVVDMLLRRIGPIDAFVALLESSGAATRLSGALRAELERRRGGGRQ